jgi:hypothetical protein
MVPLKNYIGFPHQIWLLEPYVLLTKGVLQETSTEDASISSDNSTPADASSISFPALKILYKLFDSDSCKQLGERLKP